MDMIQYWNPAIFTAGAVVLFTAVLIASFIRNFRKLDNRLKLILKTLYFNTKDIRNVGEKADLIISEHQKSIEHQQKSFDHHRVLVSSLNRQIRSLEAALNDGGYVDRSGELPSTISPPSSWQAVQENSRQVKIAESRRLQAGISAQKRGAVLLKTLLEEKKARARVAFGNEQKAAKLSTIFPNQTFAGHSEVNMDKRRVSNG